MKTRLTLSFAALLLTAGSALALTSQEVINDLATQGYTRVEVKNGATMMKVEAIRGAEKLEVIYDSATGTVLKREVEAVESDDDTAPGFFVRNRNRDFLEDDDLNDDDSFDDDDDSDDDDDDRMDDDDDDDDDKGRGRGRGGDDDRGDRDDDRDDDSGRGRGRGRGGDDD